MRVMSAVVVVVALIAAAASAQDGSSAPSLLKASFSKLPIYFVENRGVYPDDVAFTVQGADKTLFFTKGGITFRLKGKDRPWVVKLDFVGANPEVRPRGEDRQQAVFSYFKGPEKDWKTGLRTYGKIVYEDLWPGIDLIYQGTVGRLKYEFVAKPGADPSDIRLQYRGAAAVRVTGAGSIRVECPSGTFEDEPPVAWQEVDGRRVPVSSAFTREAAGDPNAASFCFRIEEYDRTRPLILDPAILLYCGYIGGAAGKDMARAIAVHAGSAYIAGGTDSDHLTFPVKVGPGRTYSGGLWCGDAFVAKVNLSGTSLVYCGYIGGNACDNARGIAVDGAGCAYVTGETMSNEFTFPIKVGPDLTFNSPPGRGETDAFVAKVNAKGTGLVYCGYIGGASFDNGTGIAVDSGGNAHVAGMTSSDPGTFPVKVGPDLSYNGGQTDGFLAKVNPQGSALVRCGYVGGSGVDSVRSIALDAAECAYVAGYTDSNDIKVTSGGRLSHFSGNYDAFVVKVNSQGTAFAYCAYIGGYLYDDCFSVAVDGAGSAYLAGGTTSDEGSFPVCVGPDRTFNSAYPPLRTDAWVAKVNPLGTGLVYCGYIGGAMVDTAYGISVDAIGNAYVIGSTLSDEHTFPIKVGFDLTYNGGHSLGDAFVAKVNTDGSALVYCSYVGGVIDDYGEAIAVDQAGNAYITGLTGSDEKTFPVTVGPDLTFNGNNNSWGGDTFVAKLAQVLLEADRAEVRPGAAVHFTLIASDDAGHIYQLGSSFGKGPIQIGPYQLGLSPDFLLAASVSGAIPQTFSGYAGFINRTGVARALLTVPNQAVLVGLRIHSAFVTLYPTALTSVKSISNTYSFTVTK